MWYAGDRCLPHHLAQEVETYRKARRGLSLSALVRELLKRPEALLEAAGLVERAGLSAREHNALIREEW
ncbi:CopG family transcriptional regulator [Thermus arciformis]|uniref:CopG family transcriptional regulator n=1 Tax=Thermus arciformis TaxID=482827 RepID=UPI001F4AB4AA|nr:CopG family transcriptional regulator [Thermus arciformis]